GSGEVQGFVCHNREPLQPGASKFIEVFKSNGGLARSPLVYCTAFVVEHLLHPKACSRTVQQAEQGEMVFLSGMVRQLDDWSGTVERLPAAVEHEVVMGGYEGKDEG